METRQDIRRLGHSPALDGLRGVAVLLVMAYHAHVRFFHWGYLGVDVFFVLSGFLITSILLEEWNDSGAVSLKNFYARRVLRLFPALALLLLASLLPLAGSSLHDRLRAASTALFYSANWDRALHWGVDLGGLAHTWSLSIEEQFYLLWPLTLVLLLRGGLSPRRLASLLFVCALASAGARAFIWLARADADRAFNGLDARADGLLTGCALSVLFTYRALPRWTGAVKAAIAVGAIVLAPLVVGILRSAWNGAFMFEAGFAAAVAAAAAIMVALLLDASETASRVFTCPALTWMGRISYGLYLWHYLLYHWLDGLGVPRPFGTPVKVAATFAVASLSFYLLERPCLRLKDRFKSVNLAAIPVDRDVPEHRALLALAEGAAADVVFLGDSITRGWLGQRAWKERFAPLKAVNFGIDGDSTGHVLWRVTDGRELEGLSPKAVVLLVGTNNLGRDGAAQIAEGVARIVDGIRRRKPSARILLLGLLPRGREAGTPLRAKLAEVNRRLARLDDGGATIRFLDPGRRLLGPDGTLSEALAPDEIHLSASGYEALAGEIAPALETLLAG